MKNTSNMSKLSKLLFFVTIATLGGILSGCEFSTSGASKVSNIISIIFLSAAGAAILFFVVFGIISAIYKGKEVEAKIMKKMESKVLRGNMMGRTAAGYKNTGDTSRKTRRQKGRIRYSKVLVEINGQEKTLNCNDFVILDKLSVGRNQRIKVKFNEIIKVMK